MDILQVMLYCEQADLLLFGHFAVNCLRSINDNATDNKGNNLEAVSCLLL
jgi:hypothetical protein